MSQILGEIRAFAFPELPKGFQPCDGRLLPVAQHEQLYSVIGNTYGGQGDLTFALPDLRGRFAMGSSSSTFALGAGAPLPVRTAPANADNSQPFLALTYGIAVEGWLPEFT